MNGALAYLLGIGFKNIRPALYGWFFNAMFSLAIYLGLYKVFYDAAGTSILAGDVTGGIGLFTFLTDIVYNNPGNFSLLILIVCVAAFLFLGFSIFIAGGIYSTLVEDEKTTFTNLVALSTENFLKMIGVFLGNILVWLVALLVPVILLVLFLSFEPGVFDESLVVVFTYIWIGLGVFLFVLSTVIYDFARIFKLKDDRNLFQTFKKSIRFTFHNKMSLLVIFLLYVLSLLILYLIYLVTASLVERLLYAFLIYIVYQGFIFVRYYLKVVVMRAEVHLTGAEQ